MAQQGQQKKKIQHRVIESAEQLSCCLPAEAGWGLVHSSSFGSVIIDLSSVRLSITPLSFSRRREDDSGTWNGSSD